MPHGEAVVINCGRAGNRMALHAWLTPLRDLPPAPGRIHLDVRLKGPGDLDQLTGVRGETGRSLAIFAMARAIAVLFLATLGGSHLAEEATAEAFATAVERWPADDVPPTLALADHHRQPQGRRPVPAREQARRQAQRGSITAVR